MKAVTFQNTRIHCDTCHHEFNGDPEQWLNKPCPKCQAPNIITDGDIRTWKVMHGIADVVNGLFGDVPETEESVTFTYSTAPTKE